MEILIIGAGASFEEGIRIGLKREECPPLMSDFAQKMWAYDDNSYAPNHLLYSYLKAQGYEPDQNPVEAFIYLINNNTENINVERFFEWVWLNKHLLGDNIWENFIYHGIGNALVFILTRFDTNGIGTKELIAHKLVAKALQPGDLVVNLNYDTLFELGTQQANVQYAYAPNQPSNGKILIAKPHGSLNMVVTSNHFKFGQPEFIHMVLQQGEMTEHLRGIVPPRFNKKYNQHPIAKIILDSIRHVVPDKLTFWGVGLTDSDTDLLDMYCSWAKSAKSITMINPDLNAVTRAGRLLSAKVKHYISVEQWAEQR